MLKRSRKRRVKTRQDERKGGIKPLHRRGHRRLYFSALLFAMSVWVLDTLFDYLVFYTGHGFLELLVTAPPHHEVYIRSLIVILFMLFAFYVSRLLRREEKTAVKMERLAEEREVLLREVHHRVKNNLLMVSSLVSLYSEGITDRYAQAKLRQIRQRIDSIALIHKHIYQDGTVAIIQLDKYINELLDQLLPILRGEAQLVELHKQLDNVEVDLDTAIPCALIINELLQNAFHHAFPQERQGSITLEVKAQKQGFRLTVKDNGVGIQEPASTPQNASLGFSLIENLTRQLDAVMDIEQDHGVTVHITVPQSKRSS